MIQEYEKYTEEDHKVWSILYAEQMQQLPAIAAKDYLKGIKKVKFEPNRIPRFEVINEALAEATGWCVYVVPGLIPNKPFFEHLSKKEFPATTWLRTMAQLKYLEEPDMFHDIFGHVPLLSEAFFADYLNGLSNIILKYVENPYAVELMARLYWYTVEFGLIREDNEIKIYGAGILSSPGECVFSVSNQATHLPFDVNHIMDTPYIKDKFQAQYFVIESYKQLFDSLPLIEHIINKVVEENIVVTIS